MIARSGTFTRKLFVFPLYLMVWSGIACADSDNVDWPLHGLTSKEERYSPLHQITDKNVSQLKPEWYMEIPSIDDGLSATPIVKDGVIYMTGSFANVFAIDGKTGKSIWEYNSGTRAHNSLANSWGARVNRGVAVAHGRVFVATPDCRLIALDAVKGTQIWEELTCDPTREYTITGAPRAAQGKVFIGNGASDFGSRGYVSAYDADSGKLIWRFWNVPGDPALGYENEVMKMAAETWAGGWAKNGGGSAWDAIVFDEELDHLYFGTDSAIPYDPSERSPGGGDNLFTNSIIAVDADTGEYKWHYQTVPNDAWDYNATNHIILADLKLYGRHRKVLMQAPKNGFFYVIDRVTGELLSAKPYIGVTWASHIDMKTGRPVENPGARYYQNEDLKAEVIPSLLGAHNWHPMSYSQYTRLVYIPAHEFKSTYRLKPDSLFGGMLFDYYGDDMAEEGLHLKPDLEGKIGRLIAWDPLKGEARWQVDHVLPMNGGVMSTAGNLVFQGTAVGGFHAFSSDTGKQLWSYNVHASVQAPPITYSVDGKQYVVASAGAGGVARIMVPLYGTGDKALGPSRLIAFTLDGKSALPEPVLTPREVPEPPESTASAEAIVRGAEIYEVGVCGSCHGSVGIGHRPPYSSIPDLRYMTRETHDQFKDIVLKGVLKENGMLSFEGTLGEEHIEDLHAFLIDRQRQLYDLQNAEKDR